MAAVLIAIHIVILGIYYYVGDPDKFDFVRMFDLDMEQNIPTLFSSALMLNSAFYIFSDHAGVLGHRRRSTCGQC